MLFTKVLQKIIEIFFPIPCVFCAKCSGWICSNCLAKLDFTDSKECPICRNHEPSNKPCQKCRSKTQISQLFYLFEYSHEVKKLIKLMKYKKYHSLRYEFATLLERFLTDRQMLDNKTLLTYAPSSKSSLQKRGFSQMAIITKMIKELHSSASYGEVFQKSDTARQATLNKKDRAQNLKGKIKLIPTLKLRDCNRLVILDDLATTGATLSECCKVFSQKYPKIEIVCVSLARPALLFKSQPP